MPESDARDPESAAPATPRESGATTVRGSGSGETAMPRSSTRSLSEPPPAPSAPGDTLLSVGPPAPRLELLEDDQLGALERRLQGVEERLGKLEQQQRAPRADSPRTSPWLWLVFLVAVAAVFQLLRLAE